MAMATLSVRALVFRIYRGYRFGNRSEARAGDIIVEVIPGNGEHPTKEETD
jgi:hypothetical protein